MKLAALAPLAVLLIAPAPARADDADRRALVGTWKAVSLERNGETFPLDAAEETRLVFGKDDRFVIRRGAESLEEGSFRVHSGEPRPIDTTPTNGPDRGRTTKGLYEIEGDTLRMCLAPPGAPRPADIASRPGSNHLFFVYRRVRK